MKSILPAMMEEREHTRWLRFRESKNPGCSRRFKALQTYPYAPRLLLDPLCHNRLHSAPKVHQENAPRRVHTFHEDRPATPPLNVLRLREGSAELLKCSLGGPTCLVYGQMERVVVSHPLGEMVREAEFELIVARVLCANSVEYRPLVKEP